VEIVGCLICLLSAAYAAELVSDRTKQETDDNFVFVAVDGHHGAVTGLLVAGGDQVVCIAGCCAYAVKIADYSAR